MNKKSHYNRYIRPNIIPDEYSIDNLLRIREEERLIEKEVFKIKEIPHFLPLPNSESTFHLSEIDDTDASIFDISKMKLFPYQIFIICPSREFNPNLKIYYLENWILKAFILFPNLFIPSEELYFKVINQMVIDDSEELGECLNEYSTQFKERLIDFEKWYVVFHETVILNVKLSAYILSSSNPDLFLNFDSNKYIFILTTSLICPFYYETNATIFIIQNLENIFELFINQETYYFLSERIVDIVFNHDYSAVGFIIGSLPTNGIGMKLLFMISSHLILKYFRFDSDPKQESQIPHNEYERLKLIADNSHIIKILCDSLYDDILYHASAVLALTEKLILSSILLEIIDNSIALKIVQSLSFSISNRKMFSLVKLKEQLHFTKTQVKMILEINQIILNDYEKIFNFQNDLTEYDNPIEDNISSKYDLIDDFQTNIKTKEIKPIKTKKIQSKRKTNISKQKKIIKKNPNIVEKDNSYFKSIFKYFILSKYDDNSKTKEHLKWRFLSEEFDFPQSFEEIFLYSKENKIQRSKFIIFNQCKQKYIIGYIEFSIKFNIKLQFVKNTNKLYGETYFKPLTESNRNYFIKFLSTKSSKTFEDRFGDDLIIKRK